MQRWKVWLAGCLHAEQARTKSNNSPECRCEDLVVGMPALDTDARPGCRCETRLQETRLQDGFHTYDRGFVPQIQNGAAVAPGKRCINDQAPL